MNLTCLVPARNEQGFLQTVISQILSIDSIKEIIIIEGGSVDKTYEEALKIYTEFANAGNTLAQQNLGYMHMVGQGTKVDYDEAMKYFRIVYQKDPVAGLSIAYMMELGLGMPQNIFESTKIYQELSQKGYVDAHISLGWKYFKGGEGVDKNHAEALRLFQLAERESKEYHSLRQALYGVGYV